MRLTYLIATHNRKATLERHLRALPEQTYREFFEAIVCDDGSTDGTHEMLQQFPVNDRFSLRWFNTGSKENTAAKSRNNGIRAAKGEIIIMMDDDNLPHRQLIEAYLNKFNHQVIQVGYKSNHEEYLSRTLPVPVEPDMQQWWDDHQAGTFGHFQCGNVCMSIEAARTTAKDGSLGFDERFTGYGHEDTEFGRRLHEGGYALSFNPDAVSWHMNPDALPQQQGFTFKETDKKRTFSLMEKIMREPWPTMAAVYPGFVNTTGMMSPGELRWLYNAAARMSSVVEIGSFAGRSAHALLSGCEGPVYCVDEWSSTFIGSKEQADDIRRAYYANTAQFGNRKVIELPSVMAARGFADKSIDMPFIDADHAYGSVKMDIEAWLPKAVKMIAGHDYSPYFPEVIQAVQEAFGDRVRVCETIWYVNLEAM